MDVEAVEAAVLAAYGRYAALQNGDLADLQG
jgi:hypothetical protein